MAASDSLYPVKEHTWRQGLGTLIRKENSSWWGTRKWWVQSLIWLAIVNGFFAIMLWLVPLQDPEETLPPAELKDLFIILFCVFTTIGVIVLSQSAIVGEKQSGTAEWMLSNPVSRSAFILAKFVAYGFSIFVILVFLQSVVFYVQLSLSEGELATPGPFILAVLLTSLNLIYFLALTLMLGAIFSSRGPVIGIAIGILIGQDIVAGLLGNLMPWLIEIMPQRVVEMAQAILQGQDPPSYLPLIVLPVSTILFILVAMWRFEKEEF